MRRASLSTTRFWVSAFLIFTIVALSNAAQMYTGLLVRAPELASWQYALVGTLPFWYSKLLLLPVVLVAGARWPLGDGPARYVPVHLVISILFAAAQLTLGMAVAYSILPPPGEALGFTGALLNLFSTYFVTGIVFYWVFLGIYYAIVYGRELEAQRSMSREFALRTSELQTQLAEVRLEALRSQLNPHFLFNSLNAVGGLCDRGDTHGAAEMVTRLGELLRLALEHQEQMTTLERELHFVDTYLAVEQVRMGSRLTIARDIPSATLQCAVPSLLLQPLVENAVRHGVGRMPGPGIIRLTARHRDGQLVLRVEDSGPGFDYPDGGHAAGRGVGLRNSVARLDQIYGGRHHFSVQPSELGGACVEIRIPPVDHGIRSA